MSAEYAKRLSEQQKAEIVQHGQAVIDRVQMKTLSEVMDLLENDLLVDKQKHYFITIDRLDENWVNDDLRYRLIKALLDTVRDFNSKIQNVKIIVALREDLLDRVFRFTRGVGDQEEKYRSLYLRLSWQQAELEELLNLRVSQLVREQYTSRSVTVRDILPSTINREDSIEYIVERTMLRPRDVIMFLNECIKAAEGSAKITPTMVGLAETAYSDNRLRALADEWFADYPNLINLALFLKQFPSRFSLSSLCDALPNRILEFLVANPPHDFIFSMADEKFDNVSERGVT